MNKKVLRIEGVLAEKLFMHKNRRANTYETKRELDSFDRKFSIMIMHM